MHGFAILPRRGIIAIGGDDRVAFLNNIVSNQVDTRPCYALLLSPQGKFLHDFFVIPTKDLLLLDCERARLPDLLQRLNRYKLRSRMTAYDASEHYAVVAAIPATSLNAPAADIYPDPRDTRLGQRILVAADWLPDLKARLLALGLDEQPVEAYEQHRLGLAIPNGSADLEPERAFPMDYGLESLNAISFEKGCYVGQELTARMKYRGLVKKQLCRVQLDGLLPAPGTPVMAGTQEAGELRSGLGQEALALLRTEFIDQSLTCNGVAVQIMPNSEI